MSEKFDPKFLRDIANANIGDRGPVETAEDLGDRMGDPVTGVTTRRLRQGR